MILVNAVSQVEASLAVVSMAISTAAGGGVAVVDPAIPAAVNHPHQVEAVDGHTAVTADAILDSEMNKKIVILYSDHQR